MNFERADRELNRHSYYAASVQRGQGYVPLQGSCVCDVAVVGGGLAGLSAALELAQRGYSVTVLEAEQVGFGASGRNGGQAIHGFACDQAVIEAQLGKALAQQAWGMSIEALDLIKQRIASHSIECEWQPGYLGVATSERKASELMRAADALLANYGYALTRIARNDLGQWIASPRYHAAVHDPLSGHLHPLKYTLGLAKATADAGVRIHERTAVTAAVAGTPHAVLSTATGEVRAAHVLLAGNVYLRGLVPQLQSRIMPVGTYIACTEPLGRERAESLIPCMAAVCDNNFVLDYFRCTADHRLLYGGRVSYSTATPPGLAASMQRRMVHTFPQLAGVNVEYTWGGFVDITMNRAPDFRRLGKQFYYLQGFSGHGLALTGLAGKLVAEAIHGDLSRFDVFSRLRHRAFPGGHWLRTPALVLGMAWYRLKDAMA